MSFINSLTVYSDLGLFLLRLSVAIIFLYHGWPKLKSKSPALAIGGLVHGLIEVAAGLALIFGWQVQLAALVLAVIMLSAIYMKKFKWNIPFSSHTTTGWEFDFILLAANLAILLSGGGAIFR